MAEFDTIPVHNPMNEDWMHRFNGEAYILKAQETKFFPVGLAFHIAKHLSEKALAPELAKIKEEKPGQEDPRVPQLMIYDNPSRRIALYNILGTKELVETCVRNTNLKGFIGEMSVYDEYVANKTGQTVKATPVVKAEVPPPPPPAPAPQVKEPEVQTPPPPEPPKEEKKEDEVPPAAPPQVRRGRPPVTPPVVPSSKQD